MNVNKSEFLSNQEGILLIMSVGIVIFLLLLGLLFITILTTDVRNTRLTENSHIAFYIADAGINYAMPFLDADGGWRDGVTMNFNGGSFTVTVTDESGGVVVLKSVGSYKGAQRTLKVKIKMGNWPNFKYDHERTAFSSPQHIVARELRFRWYFQAGDDIRSSPAIDFNKVVFGCNDNRVYCLKANDGTLVWSYLTGNDVVSSPAIDNNRVFFGSNDGTFYCLNLESGAVVWTYRNVSNPRPWQASPVVYCGVIYTASNDGRVYAFNADDGTILPGWPYLVGDNVVIYSSPTLDPSRQRLYIGADDGYFYSISTPTVSNVVGWPYNTGAAIKSTACIDPNGYIYQASTNGRLYSFRLDGTYRWRTSAFLGYVQSSPSYSPFENTIFLGSGIRRYYGFWADNGLVVDWYNHSRPVDSTGAVQDDQVFVGNDNDYVVALNTWNLRRRFRYDCRGDVNSSPAIYGNNLYAGADSNRLYKFSSEVTPTGVIVFMQNSWRDSY